eukprot:3584809-Amphidinium_carterae.1
MEVLSVLRARPPSALQVFMHEVISRVRSVPYSDVYKLPHVSDVPCSGRRRSRFCKERNFREFVHFVTLAVNWLHFGRPRHGRCADLVPLEWSAAQLKLALPTLEGLQAWYRSRRVACDSDGTPLLDVGLSRLVSSLACVAGHYGKAETHSQGAEGFRSFLRPSHCVLPSHLLGRLSRRKSPNLDDWLSVLSALLDCGLCELIPDHLAPRHMGMRVSAGLFGVPKKGSDYARLIIDRRAQNSREIGLRTALAGLSVRGAISMERLQELTCLCTLPYVGQFTRLMLCSLRLKYLNGRGERLLLSSTMGVPDYQHPGTAVRSEHLSSAHLTKARSPWGDSSLWAATVISSARKDQKAPGLLTAGGGFAQKHMVYGEPAPLTDCWQSVYIDDYC